MKGNSKKAQCTSLREVESTVQEMPKIKQVVRNKFTFRAPLVLSSVSCVELYVSRHQPIPLTLVAQTLKSLPSKQETGFDPWVRKIPCLQNPMDRGAWQATVHGVAKSQTQLSD